MEEVKSHSESQADGFQSRKSAKSEEKLGTTSFALDSSQAKNLAHGFFQSNGSSALHLRGCRLSRCPFRFLGCTMFLFAK